MLNKLTTFSQKLKPGLRQAFSNIVWLFADRFIQMGFSLLIGIWVSRYLGPKQYGNLSYAITFVSLFSSVADAGLGNIVVRDIARDPSGKNETLGTTFTLRLVGGVLTLLIAIVAISALSPHDSLTRWLVGIAAAGTIFQAFDTISFWFEAQVQSKYIVIAKNASYVLICLIRITLVQLKAPLIAFAWARLLEVILAALGLTIVYQLRGNNIKVWRTSLQRAKELLSESWSIVLSGLAIYVYATIDQVMLGSMLNDKTELGIYSAAVKLSEIFNFLPVILTTSVFPKLTEAKEKRETEYLAKLQAYFDLMAILWFSVAIPVSLSSPLIIKVLYGDSYAAAAGVLSLYVWSQFGSNFGVARNSFLTIESKLKFSLYFSVIGAIINVLINLLLIPKYGALGTTYATLITYFIVVVLLNFFSKEIRPVGLMIIRSLNLYRAILRVSKLIR